MTVSVLIAAFNAARTLPATLDSVCAQTYRDLQIIVVDDGSTDDTSALIVARSRHDPRIVAIAQPNAGPSAARNHALRRASGEFVAALDADDLWHPTFVAKMVGTLRDAGPSTVFAYAPHRVIDESDRVLMSLPIFGCAGAVFAQHLLVNFVGTGSAMLARRSAVLEVGGYDSRADVAGGGEDYLLQLRLAAHGPVALRREYLVAYRRRAGSLSQLVENGVRARMFPLEQVFAENASLPVQPLRWAKSEALRVAAVKHLQQRRVGRALAGSSHALLLDPVATTLDALLRVRNRFRRAANGEPPSFHRVDPTAADDGTVDWLTRHRLARLRRWDLDRPASSLDPRQSVG